MTKKQLAALQRIIDREAYQIIEKSRNQEMDTSIKQSVGVHPSCDRFVVTDGYMAVIFCDKPEGVQEAERMDSVYNVVQKDIEAGNHFLSLTVTEDHIKEWKKLSKDWKAGKTHKTGAVPINLSAQNNDGGTATGFYDPRYLVDAAEAIGPGAMFYIGRYSQYSPFYSLLAFPKNWMENSSHAVGYVLPLRIVE